MNLLGYRKLIAYLFGCSITGALMLLERITPGTFEVVMIGLAGGFFAANVTSKFSNRPTAPTPATTTTP